MYAFVPTYVLAIEFTNCKTKDETVDKQIIMLQSKIKYDYAIDFIKHGYRVIPLVSYM